MRILHVVAADRWTGAAAVALRDVEALRMAGHDVRLVFRPGDTLASRLRGMPWAFAAMPKERSVADLWRSVAVVGEAATSCEAVHCHLPHDHALARLALRPFGPETQRPRLVRSLHHPRHLRRDPFHRWLLRRTDGVGLANSAMAAAWRRWQTDGERTVRVLPPCAEPRFKPQGDRHGIRSRFEIPAGAVVAGTVGKLHRLRGQDLVLHALAAAPGVWGLLVGAGEHEDALRRLSRRLGVAPRVRFAGFVDEGLEDHYAAMDIFVFPSAGSEWGHRAIAEASACGLPTLAADLPGVADLVEPDATGGFFPSGDAAALAVQLRRWGAVPERRQAAGRAAARRAACVWTQAALAAATVSLYLREGRAPEDDEG